MLLASLVLGAFCAHAAAKPSAALVSACLHTASASSKVRYTSIAADSFHVTEDEEAGITHTTFRHGTDTVGTWEVKKPRAFGLLINGKKTSLVQVTRLDKRKAPEEFSPYEAIWGEARARGKSYICATFNFDGVGKSGSFQHVRGLYLIERSARAKTVFYTSGNIEVSEK